MTWMKVDDSFHSHPKVLATDPAALGLWVIAGSWCGANLTDGFVPDYVLLRLLPGSETLAQKLVTTGLWRRAKGGYRFHDWSEYNPSAESVRTEREAAKERMRALREKQRANRDAAAQPPDRSPEQQPNVRAKFGDPDPTRPGSSSRTTPKRTTSSSGAQRGTRIPDDFTATDAMKEWARTNTPLAGLVDHEMFVDHWRAQSGQRAVKLDWGLTWKNWMRRVQENKARFQQPPRQTRSTTDDRVTAALEAGARLQAVADRKALGA
jgi:hypothetical protein